jgi:hypothetical protein
MLAQAEGYRSRQRARDLPASFGAEALHGAAAELEAEATESLLAPLPPEPAEPATAPVTALAAEPEPAPAQHQVHQRYDFHLVEGDEKVDLSLELIRNVAQEFYGFTVDKYDGAHRIDIWLNLSHPFSESYVNSDENTISPLIRLVTAMVFAEYSAQQAGIKRISSVRHRVNELLRDRFGEGRAGGVGDAR